MPWEATSGIGIYFAAGDVLVSSGAASTWTLLHYSAGGTYDAPVFTAIARFTIPTLSSNHMIWSTTAGPGAQVYVTSAGAVKVEITDAASSLIHPTCATANGVIINGAEAVITVICDGSDVVVRVNGVQAATQAFDTAASSADPAATLQVGAQGTAAYPLLGGLDGLLICDEALAGASLTYWEATV
jgi:hypothetical protein